MAPVPVVTLFTEGKSANISQETQQRTDPRTVESKSLVYKIVDLDIQTGL